MSDERPPTIDRRRLTLLGLCLTFGAAVIAAQLVRYQVVMHTELKERANKQRTRVVEVPPPRGYITDAQGRILAMNVFQWEISASPSLVTNAEDSPHILADRIKGEVYFACAENDDYVPDEVIRSLEAHLARTEVHYRVDWYPGTQHGFAFVERKEAYDRASAERLWDRLFALFRRNLRPPSDS